MSQVVVGSQSAAERWPLAGTPDFSSGFGDFRDGRFHAGLDLRTGGVTGQRLFSPVSGWVSRVSMSYRGYGRGLYITGDNGFIYVLAHLNGFIPSIDSVVKDRQEAARRYAIDVRFPKDSIRVTAGQLIGWTGQSGVGAPHLHFEKRTANNEPIHPGRNGFSYTDRVPPSAERIGFEYVDDASLFSDATRRQFMPLNSAASGNYRLKETPVFSAPFGILLEAFDRTRPDGMVQMVHQARLLVDSQVVSELTFDQLDFGTGHMVKQVYAYSEASSGEKRVVRLHRRPGTSFAGYRFPDQSDGVIGRQRLSYGLHDGQIELVDGAGNRSSVSFRFYWVPAGGAFRFDSLVAQSDSVWHYHFTEQVDRSQLGVDSVQIQINRGAQWGRGLGTSFRREGNRLVATATGRSANRVVMRLAAFCRYGAIVTGEPFSGIDSVGQKGVDLDYQIDEDGGLILRAVSNAKVGHQATFFLFNGQQELARATPTTFINHQQYAVYVPPKAGMTVVDRIAVSLVASSPHSGYVWVDSLQVCAVGFKSADTLRARGGFSVVVRRDNLFAPRFISLGVRKITAKSRFAAQSDLLLLSPEIMPLAANFELQLTLQDTNSLSKYSGLCWLDERRDQWVWVSDSYESGRLVAATSGGGSFAAIRDMEPPELGYRNVIPGRQVADRRPTIEFRLRDTLSGIEDDQSIEVLLNKVWLIPEYDPEREILSVQPRSPLKLGEQHLTIAVTDRAGNRIEEIFRFTVVEPTAEQKKPARGRKK